MRFMCKYHRVALLLVGSAILLSACEQASEGQQSDPIEKLMTEYSENRTIIATENGVKQYQFYTPLLEGYTAGDEPYREFRRGIHMITFKKDSSDQVDVTLTANYAIYYEKRKLWEAKGNVVVKKFDGKTLYTEQLFWNDVTNKIYSNVDSKIVEPDGETYVSGFESDEEFRYWSAREMDGRMEVEFKPTPPDSTATEKPDSIAPKKKPAVKNSSNSEAERRREEARKRAEERRLARQRQAELKKQSAPQSKSPKKEPAVSKNIERKRVGNSTNITENPTVNAPKSFTPRDKVNLRAMPNDEKLIND